MAYVPNKVFETDTIRMMMNKLNQSMDSLSDYADFRISELIGSAPKTLDTLLELANALNNDADFANAMLAKLEGKANIEDLAILEKYTDDSIANMQVYFREEVFMATANQVKFTLNEKYVVGEGHLKVEIGGVPQYAPTNFVETSDTSFTVSEPLPEGIYVVARYMSPLSPIAISAAEIRSTMDAKAMEINGIIETLEDFKTGVLVTATSMDAKLEDVSDIVDFMNEDFIPGIALSIADQEEIISTHLESLNTLIEYLNADFLPSLSTDLAVLLDSFEDIQDDIAQKSQDISNSIDGITTFMNYMNGEFLPSITNVLAEHDKLVRASSTLTSPDGSVFKPTISNSGVVTWVKQV